MNQRLSDIAYAKINLALHVRKRREDGYHEIETLFAFLDDGDRLSVAPSTDLTLSIDGLFGDDLDAGPDNLVPRAVALLRERANIRSGAHFSLTKRLPVASGIGGGSADAAAALRLAARLWGMAADDPLLLDLAATLGADVPACVRSETAFGAGTGTGLTPIVVPDVARAPVLLVNPLLACPTAPVFAGWDGQDRGALDPQNWRRGRNDLQEPALALCPEIQDVLTVLRAQLPVITRMSGSGATCFALFSSAALRDAAAQRIMADHPDWWLMSGHLR